MKSKKKTAELTDAMEYRRMIEDLNNALQEGENPTKCLERIAETYHAMADVYYNAWCEEYARNEALTGVIGKLLHYADINVSVQEG